MICNGDISSQIQWNLYGQFTGERAIIMVNIVQKCLANDLIFLFCYVISPCV